MSSGTSPISCADLTGHRNTAGVMIPLTVLRRLDCVLEKNKDEVVTMYKKLKGEGKDAEAIEKIIEKFKFDEEVEKLEEANRLFLVMQKMAEVNLHPQIIPNIAMGYVF